MSVGTIITKQSKCKHYSAAQDGKSQNSRNFWNFNATEAWESNMHTSWKSQVARVSFFPFGSSLTNMSGEVFHNETQPERGNIQIYSSIQLSKIHFPWRTTLSTFCVSSYILKELRVPACFNLCYIRQTRGSCESPLTAQRFSVRTPRAGVSQSVSKIVMLQWVWNNED